VNLSSSFSIISTNSRQQAAFITNSESRYRMSGTAAADSCNDFDSVALEQQTQQISSCF
jgi:Asp/Glu/hydantoin racemase